MWAAICSGGMVSILSLPNPTVCQCVQTVSALAPKLDTSLLGIAFIVLLAWLGAAWARETPWRTYSNYVAQPVTSDAL